MKKIFYIILITIIGIVFLSVGPVFASQRVIVPYVIHGNGWSTGVVVTNLENEPIDNIRITFVHTDGNFDGTDDRAELGDFDNYEMKVSSLQDLYNGTLPEGQYSLYIYHLDDEQRFGVAVFITNNVTGISGYGFQQFYSETF